jgi:hypothetical protein
LVSVDKEKKEAIVLGGTRLYQITRELRKHGLAFENLVYILIVFDMDMEEIVIIVIIDVLF